jgi:hypothetical protein
LHEAAGFGRLAATVEAIHTHSSIRQMLRQRRLHFPNRCGLSGAVRGGPDGFGACEFHGGGDGHAPILTLMQDTGRNIFGNFTPVEWEEQFASRLIGLKSLFLRRRILTIFRRGHLR